MTKYEKIQTLWKRDPERKHVIMPYHYSKPEFENVRVYEITEKIDGTNIRITFTRINNIPEPWVIFEGRTDKAVISTPLLEFLQNKFTSELLGLVFDLSKANKVVLYGEGYGPKIQKGGKYRDDVSFILFDVLIDGVWLEGEKVTEIAADLNIDRVPILGYGTTDKAEAIVLKRPNTEIGKEGEKMEGVVCRSYPLVLDRFGKRVIFKLKLRDYDQLDRVQMME